MGGKYDGFKGGGADFVYGCADRRVGHASANGALSSWGLAETERCELLEFGVEKEEWEPIRAYFAERTLPKNTSSTSEGLMLGTLSKAAGRGWYSSLGY